MVLSSKSMQVAAALSFKVVVKATHASLTVPSRLTESSACINPAASGFRKASSAKQSCSATERSFTVSATCAGSLAVVGDRALQYIDSLIASLCGHQGGRSPMRLQPAPSTSQVANTPEVMALRTGRPSPGAESPSSKKERGLLGYST
jgi:hypothetical protein